MLLINYLPNTLSELFTTSQSIYNSEQQYGQANTKHILSCYELPIKLRSIHQMLTELLDITNVNTHTMRQNDLYKSAFRKNNNSQQTYTHKYKPNTLLLWQGWANFTSCGPHGTTI